MLAYVNRRRFNDVPARLALWNKAGGRVVRGLSRRCAAEGDLFLRPTTPDGTHAETFELQQAGHTVEAQQGKSMLQSTTNRAAAGLTLAVILDQAHELIGLVDRGKEALEALSEVLPWPGHWMELIWPVGLCLAALAACGWIVRERMKKSVELGV